MCLALSTTPSPPPDWLGLFLFCLLFASPVRLSLSLFRELAVIDKTLTPLVIDCANLTNSSYFQAGEPLFTALFSALFLGQFFTLPVYAALLPVVGGVAVASLKELSFT